MKKGQLLRVLFGLFVGNFGPFFANFSHVIFREKSFARPSFVFAKNAKNCAALVSTFSYSDGDSMFAKPFPVKPKLKATEIGNEQENKKSLAKMILMRESLAGLPRASLSGLFRQSLSIQELDRMFDDDSTQSFEDLERRLKTPAKAKASSRITDKVQEESPKNDSKTAEKVSNCKV